MKLGKVEKESSVQLSVEGMTCASCVRRVENALSGVPGVKSASVNLATETAEVELEDNVDPTSLVSAVSNVGYEAKVAGESQTLEEASMARQSKRRAELASRKRKLWVGAVLSAAVIVVSYGFSGRSWANPVQWILATPVYFWVGWIFHRTTLKTARHLSVNMDTLVSLGSSVAYFYSVAAILFLSGQSVYFDVSSLIITLISLGKYFELSARSRAGESLEALMTLRPSRVHLLARADSVIAGNTENAADVPVDSLRIGDLVIVRPGEAIPTDGEVVEGAPSIDESLVTGESVPVVKSPGEALIGGSVNGMTPVIMKVTKTGDETVLAQIVTAVQKAQLEKSKVQRLADSVSAVFVPAIIAVSLVTLAGWMLTGHSFIDSLIPAVAVLVIACPCALGLATPIATLVGTSKGAKSGILLSGGDSLEVAKFIKAIVIDKTGTVTFGKPKVVGQKLLNGFSETQAFSVAASLEAGSEHPLARAVTEAALSQLEETGTVKLDEHRVEPGMGVYGSSTDDGVKHEYLIGSLGYLESKGVAYRSDDLAMDFGASSSFVALSIDGILALVFAVSDPVRPNAKEAVRKLQSMGLRVILASGDREPVVKKVASELGMDEAYYEMKPDEKAELVKGLKQRYGVVAMVGDGINDAPALATADVGIAIGSGTAIAMSVADMTLVHGDISAIADAIALSRATRKIIWQNLGWAFGYNLVLVPLAVFGQVPPIFAALAMATSSVSVVLNSLRLRNFAMTTSSSTENTSVDLGIPKAA